MAQATLEHKMAPIVESDMALRDEWLTAIEKLNMDVSEWIAELPGWSVTHEPDKEIQEERLGAYTVPVLRILSDSPDGELVLEPMARMTRGGRGRVDFYAWPTLYRVRLINDAPASGWEVLTDSGITLHQEWNKDNFLRLAKDLLGA